MRHNKNMHCMSNKNYVFLDPLEIPNNLSQIWTNCPVLEICVFSDTQIVRTYNLSA